MEIFNIGVGELLFVLILVFILLGPDRMAKGAGQLGKELRNLVNSPVWKEINKSAQDLNHLTKEILDETGGNDTVGAIEDINQGLANLNHINLEPAFINRENLEQPSEEQDPEDMP